MNRAPVGRGRLLVPKSRIQAAVGRGAPTPAPRAHIRAGVVARVLCGAVLFFGYSLTCSLTVGGLLAAGLLREDDWLIGMALVAFVLLAGLMVTALRGVWRC